MFKGIKVPSSNDGYMKLEKDNKIRILGDAIKGWEIWEDVNGKRRPIRVKEDEKGKLTETAENKAKYFWIMPVWNYKEEKVQILEITQKTIMNLILGYLDNPEYGEPTEYDLVITANGEGKERRYTTMANPPKPLSPEIEKAFSETYLNLEVMYEGGNPFDQSAGM